MTITIQKKPSIDYYFESMGIKECTSRSSFWEHVHQVDPNLAEELEPLFNRQKKGSLYEVKNWTLPFSLAVESWTMSFHKAFLNWLSGQTQLRPKRILEIGCDNGLLACWYAKQFPDAEIVAIDIEANGIQCARQLASQLRLDNVTFFQMNFMELKERYLQNSFDLIISTRTFHEIMGPVLISRYWSLPEYMKQNPTYGNGVYLQVVNHLLTENGTFLSCERLENPGDLGRWANSLGEAKLYVQWDGSEIIDYQELGVNKRSPVILATKRETGKAALDGMNHLFIKNNEPVFVDWCSYRGAKAEYAFHRFSTKQFHSGQYLDVANHWYAFRFELWETCDYLLIYCSGNMGHRYLEILPVSFYPEAKHLLEQAIEPFRHLGPIVRYKNLEERPG